MHIIKEIEDLEILRGVIMKNNDMILKKEINNGIAYVVIFVIGLILVLSMITYIKGKVDDISSGNYISESE